MSSNKKLPSLSKDDYKAINATMFEMTQWWMKRFPDHPEFKDNFMVEMYLTGVAKKPDAAIFVDKARPDIFKHADKFWKCDETLIDDSSIDMFSLIDMGTLYPQVSNEEKAANWRKIHIMMRQMKVPGGPSASPPPPPTITLVSSDVKQQGNSESDLAFVQSSMSANLSDHPSMAALQQGAHALLKGRIPNTTSASASSSSSSSFSADEKVPSAATSSVPEGASGDNTSNAEQYIELFEALHKLMENLEKEDAGQAVDDDDDDQDNKDQSDDDSDDDNSPPPSDEKDRKEQQKSKKQKRVQSEQKAMLVVCNIAFMDAVNSFAIARGERFPVLKYCQDFFCLGLPIQGSATGQRHPSYFSGSHLGRSEAYHVILATFRKFPGFAGQVELPKHMQEEPPISEEAKKKGELIDEQTGKALNQVLGIKVGTTSSSSSSSSTPYISKRQKEEAKDIKTREKYILEDKIPELKAVGAKEIYLNFAKKESNRQTVWKYVDKLYQIIDKAEEVRNGDFKGFGKLANRILQEIAAGMANSKDDKDVNPMQKMASVLTQAAKKLDKRKNRQKVRKLMTTFDDPQKANRAFELIGDIGGDGLANEMRREYDTASTSASAVPPPSS